MIKIYPDPITKKKVRLEIDSNMCSVGQLYLYLDCASDMLAELLSRHLRDQLSNEMRRIRQTEYEAGWRDAKSKKRPKRKYFLSSFS